MTIRRIIASALVSFFQPALALARDHRKAEHARLCRCSELSGKQDFGIKATLLRVVWNRDAQSVVKPRQFMAGE